MFYVHVIGPYDNTFVGGFTTLREADIYIAGLDHTTFSAYTLTANQFRANVAEFGAAPIESPEVTQ